MLGGFGGSEVSEEISASEVAAVLSFWESFNLEERKTQLDKFEIEIEENHSKSLLSRKKLAEGTKQFRKLTDVEEKSKKIGPLLRSYQEEIDSLTKRAKFSDSAFRELYKALYEAKDPVPLLRELQACKEHVGQLELEQEKLRRELEENEEEFEALQNQDVTIRKLEDELEEARKEMKRMVEAAKAERENEMLTELDTKSKEYEAKLDRQRLQLLDLEAKLSEQQAFIDKQQEELFEARTALEENEATHQSELDLLTDDLQRANSQIASLELERDRLRAAANSSGQGLSAENTRMEESNEQDRRRVLELEDELIRKHDMEERLRAEISRYQEEMDMSFKDHAAREKDLQDQIKELNEQLFSLKVQLNSRPTNEAFKKLKQQIQMLQAIDLGEMDVEDDAVTALEKQNMEGGFDSRVLMHGRIRKLEATASSLRVELQSCKEQLDAVRHEKVNVEERLKDQEELIRKLEMGNSVLDSHSRRKSNSASNNNNNNSNQMGEEFSGGIAADLLRAATEGVEIKGFSNHPPSLSPRDEAEGSLLGIVHEQRNEFRKRMLELEAERDQLLSKLASAEQDIETIRGDNVTLYEKIRYLQSYTPSFDLERGQMKSNQRPERVANLQGKRRESGAGGDHVEARYKNMYEERMNPFADFSAREKRKRYKGLNAAERITLNATNFFLSNKYTRSFVFFYALTLHLLVFLALFVNTHSSCDTHLYQRPHDPHQFSPQHASLHNAPQD